MYGRFLSGDGFVWAVSIWYWSIAVAVIDTTTAITKNCTWLVILAGWASTTTTFIPAVIARYLQPIKFTNTLTDTIRLGFPQSKSSYYALSAVNGSVTPRNPLDIFGGWHNHKLYLKHTFSFEPKNILGGAKFSNFRNV